MKQHLSTNKKSRRSWTTAVSMGAILWLTACSGSSGDAPEAESGEPVEGGTLNIALSDEPSTLDTMTTRSVLTQIFSTHIMEQLFALDANFEPQPMLVSDYELSEDGTVYTFNLRDDVTFHNGDELISDDVVASLARFKELTGVGATALANSEVSAPDDKTVVVSFEQPNGNLLSALSDRQAPIYPASVLESAEPGPLPPEDIIGTGPYEYTNWAPGVEIILSEYDDYAPVDAEASGVAGKKIAYADELRFAAVPDSASRIAAIESGQFHIGEGFGGDDAQLINQSPTLEANRMRLGKLMMIVNTTLPPLDDPAIRRAIQVGLDADAFGQVLGDEENWNTSPSLLPSDVPLSSDAGAEDYNRDDVEEAKRLLEEAGYDGTPISIMTPALSGPRSQAVIMQEQLQNMGVEATIDEVELTVMQTRRGEPDSGWNMVSSQVSGQTDITQTSFLLCGNRYSYICEEDIDQAMDNFTSSVTEEERQEAYNQIQEEFYEYVPAYLTTEFWDLYAVHEDLEGFANEVQPFFWNTWISN